MLAEDAYVLKDFCKANEIYKKILTEVETPFHEEMIKGIESASKCNDEDQLLSISIKLAKGGIPVSFFKQFDNTYWYHWFLDDFAEYEKHYRENYNPLLKERIISLIKEDSAYNAEYHKFREGAKYVSLEYQITGAESISSQFADLNNEYGFPSEKRMGYNLSDGQLKDYDLWTLILHIYQRGEILYENANYTRLIGVGDMHFLDEIFLDNNIGCSGIPDYGIVNEIQYRYIKYLRI